MRRASRARLRSEVEAVDPHDLARFLPTWQEVGPSARKAVRPLAVVERLAGARLIASTLETDVLADRGVDHGLDDLLASGEAVWIGKGRIGDRDGALALYPRSAVPSLHWSADVDRPDGPLHDAIRDRLTVGASFFADLYAATGGGDPIDTLSALWDLVWAGEVTNDTLSPVRAFVRGATPTRRRGRPALSSATPPSAVGRWSAVADLRTSNPTAEESATAIARVLLERHGIVGRDTVLAEGVPGGYASLYPVFAALEDVGTARRGYFVEGLGGSQFGVPGAVDLLRTRDTGGLVVIAASDPANAYGAGIAWPEHPVAKAARRAGAYVVIDNGALIAFVDRGGRSVSAYGDDAAAVARGLALVGPRFRHWTIERINTTPSAESPFREVLIASGFTPGYRGLTFRGK